MIVYRPVYDQDRRQVWKLESAELKVLSRPRGEYEGLVAHYKPGIGFFGSVYHDRDFYLTEAEAWNYWNQTQPRKPYTLDEIRELEKNEEAKTA